LRVERLALRRACESNDWHCDELASRTNEPSINTPERNPHVSEQNPSEAFPPQPPQQAFGAAAQPPPQQSFGQAPPGQGSFGAAPPPAQPGQPGQPGQPVPGVPDEPAPVKKKSGLVRVVVTLVVIGAIAAGGWWFTRDNAVNAQVGDCLAGTTPEELNADKLKKVDCTQSDAGFKVVERVENKTEAEANSACTESTEDRWVFWSGESGKSGTVLCLARNTP
jgi:hypothetical protein